MSPNPFTIPLKNSVLPVKAPLPSVFEVPAPTAASPAAEPAAAAPVEPVAAPLVMTIPPPPAALTAALESMFATSPAEPAVPAGTAAQMADAAVLTAAPAESPGSLAAGSLAPPALTTSAAAPAPSADAPGETGGSYGTWSEPAPSPSASIVIRDAFRKLRRAQLSRVVRSVVLASFVLCVAGAARAGIQAASPTYEVTHARLVMHDHALVQSFVTVHDDDFPSLAAPTPKHAGKHAGGRKHHRKS